MEPRQIPVLIGADGPKGMRQAARIADGVFLPCVRSDVFRWRLPRLREGATASERTLEQLEVWTRTMVCVDDDLKRRATRCGPTRRRVPSRSTSACCAGRRPDAEELKAVLPAPLLDEIMHLGRQYDYYQHEKRGAAHAAELSAEAIDSFVFCGPPGRVVERIRELRSAGVNRISMVLYALSDKKRAMRRFVDEVYPHVASEHDVHRLSSNSRKVSARQTRKERSTDMTDLEIRRIVTFVEDRYVDNGRPSFPRPGWWRPSR